MPPPFAKALVGMTIFGGAIESKKQRIEAQNAQAMLRNGYSKYSPYARDYDPHNGPYTDRHGNPAYFGIPNCRGSTRPWFEVPNHPGSAQPGPGMGFITPYTANPKGRFGGDLGRNDIRKILRGARGDRIGRMPRHPHPSNIVNAGHGSWSPEYPDESEIDDIDEDTWDTTSMVSSDSGSWERYHPEAAVNVGLLGPTYGPDRRLHGRSGSSRRRLQWDDGPFYENRGGIARVPGRSGRDPHRTGAYRSRSMGSGDWATDGGY